MAGVLIGRDEGEMADRLAAAVKAFGVGRRRQRVARGAPRALDHGHARRGPREVRRFAEAGVERIMLQDFLPWDLDMIDVMGEALVGQV